MISPQHIPKEVAAVAATLEAAGYEAYLVGGCVRDLVLGREPKDWDITTNAIPEQIVALFPETYQNNDYGTVGVVTLSENPRLKVVEITPYRTESTYSDARRPDSVTFAKTLDEDLTRRDFTINAIAYRISTDETADHFEGKGDMKKRLIRAVGDAKVRFAEDALRMMRAVRIAVELDFMIDGETMAAIAEQSHNLSRISKERIRDEFIRIIESPQPMQGIIYLEKLGMLEHVLPVLKVAIGVEQNKTHAYTVYEHLLRTMQHGADKGWSTEIRLAGLLHDIGKPESRRYSKDKKDWTFHGHEVIGARLATKALLELKVPRETLEKVVMLVRWHMFFSDPALISLTAVRRTIRNVGEENINDLLNLRICDRIGTGRPKEQPFRFRKYKAMVDEALRDPISVKMLKIDGVRIMEVTGEKPGPKLGDTLHALLEEVLEDPSKNTAQYLEERAQVFMAMDASALRALGTEARERKEEAEGEELKKIHKSHGV
jgi:poly(A) polymerase/tRNA nucleotidyltransferase (CCA-adding enzyme)